MAGRILIKLNAKGHREILRSAKVTADLEARGRRMASAAGPGVGTRTTRGAQRSRVVVMTETNAARRAEAERKTLTRSIDAARG
ncbi:hypothetical protein SAMN04487781_3224 [Cellulosimicrobium cellulans]|nr:hypothetical protein SAMN04487781_3224 [Cellulosimicrobium cellulans]